MISYDMETIRLINLFEKLTGAEVKDCFKSDNGLTFVVQPESLGRAIGKGGSNIRRVSEAVRKQVKIIEFNPDPCKFVSNLLFPIKPVSIRQNDAAIVIKAHDVVEKGRIFGREKTNLKRMQDIVSKYFPVELKVE